MKRFLKWTFRTGIAIILFMAIAYASFHIWEYATGGKYVEYLTRNSETIPLEETFTYQNMADDINRSKIILVGEVHGVKEPSKFDVDFFKHLHKSFGVRHYVAELDFVQAKLMNEFLENGDEALLDKILERWVVVQGRNNQDYFNKFVALQSFYKSLPAHQKFQFIGIDRMQDFYLMFDYLKTYAKNPEKINADDYTVLSLIDEIIANTNNKDTLAILSHLKTNHDYVVNKQERDEVMLQNFSYLVNALNLSEHKLYGFFGLNHIFQYQVNGKDPFAAKLRKSDLGYEDKILSINFMINDSHMVWQSSQLPAFMQDEGAYTKMAVSVDNMLLVYLVGVKDFKRMTPNHHKSLIKMNAPDSPYAESIRLNKTIQLLPLTEKVKMNDKGKPYTQFTVFVRNSDWAEPMRD